MPALLIDGKAIAEQIRGELAPRVAELTAAGRRPGLAAVIVGDDPGSAIYVRNKAKACAEIGVHSEVIRLPGETPEAEVLAVLEGLNARPDIHGILVQQPFPEHVHADRVVRAVHPAKDVDCFHPENVGALLLGTPRFLPATPAGVVELLVRSGNTPDGRHVVILGRSNIVGKPLAAMLMQKRAGANATVTVCHSASRDLARLAASADILVAAIGQPRFVTADLVREGAVVIDVGINRIPDASAKSGSRVVGDVDFEAVREKAAAITPVPGGVGPMTIAMLLRNTVRAAQASQP